MQETESQAADSVGLTVLVLLSQQQRHCQLMMMMCMMNGAV